MSRVLPRLVSFPHSHPTQTSSHDVTNKNPGKFNLGQRCTPTAQTTTILEQRWQSDDNGAAGTEISDEMPWRLLHDVCTTTRPAGLGLLFRCVPIVANESEKRDTDSLVHCVSQIIAVAHAKITRNSGLIGDDESGLFVKMPLSVMRLVHDFYSLHSCCTKCDFDQCLSKQRAPLRVRTRSMISNLALDTPRPVVAGNGSISVSIKTPFHNNQRPWANKSQRRCTPHVAQYLLRIVGTTRFRPLVSFWLKLSQTPCSILPTIDDLLQDLVLARQRDLGRIIIKC